MYIVQSEELLKPSILKLEKLLIKEPQKKFVNCKCKRYFHIVAVK